MGSNLRYLDCVKLIFLVDLKMTCPTFGLLYSLESLRYLDCGRCTIFLVDLKMIQVTVHTCDE